MHAKPPTDPASYCATDQPSHPITPPITHYQTAALPLLAGALLTTALAPALPSRAAQKGPAAGATFEETMATLILAKELLKPVKRYIEIAQYDPGAYFFAVVFLKGEGVCSIYAGAVRLFLFGGAWRRSFVVLPPPPRCCCCCCCCCSLPPAPPPHNQTTKQSNKTNDRTAPYMMQQPGRTQVRGEPAADQEGHGAAVLLAFDRSDAVDPASSTRRPR